MDLKKYMSKSKKGMKKKELISIFLVSFYIIAMVYLLILYKFSFEFSKINILIILKWYPVSLFLTLVDILSKEIRVSYGV